MTELIEEYSVQSKRILTRLLQAVLVLHLLCLGTLPLWPLLFSLAAHLFYALLLDSFPYIQLSSPSFVISCALVLCDHFIWFHYFSSAAAQRASPIGYKFSEIASVFGLLVWMVPFSLFISLSASDYTLPATMDDPGATGTPRKRQKNTVRALLESLFGAIRNLFPIKSAASPKVF